MPGMRKDRQNLRQCHLVDHSAHQTPFARWIVKPAVNEYERMQFIGAEVFQKSQQRIQGGSGFEKVIDDQDSRTRQSWRISRKE